MDCSILSVPPGTPRPAGSQRLAGFRDGAYLAFRTGREALMNLGDALLTETNARSLGELSLSPHFTRQGPACTRECRTPS